MRRGAWVVAGWLLLSSHGSAQTTSFERAHSRRPVDGQPLQATGYVLPQGQVELGVLFAGYGITDWLTVGVQPIPWVAAPAFGGFSVNAAVKVGLPIGSLLDLALEVNPIWFRVEVDDSEVRGLLLPITLATSFHPHWRQHYSLAVRYASAEGLNDREVETQSIAGAALTRLVQLIAQLQFQLTRGVAIYLQGTLQSWERELRIEGSGQLGDRTRVEIEGAASPVDRSPPWAAIAGVHLQWSAVNLRIGAGYGNVFVPRIGLTTRRYEGVIPDFDLYVRF